MRYDKATEDFVYKGIPRPGFPLFSNDELEPLEPFHSFFLEEFLDNGSAVDTISLQTYASRLWDFANFLNTNHIDWRPTNAPFGQGPVYLYRDWAKDTISNLTLKRRLDVVQKLYEWAFLTGRINYLPFRRPEIRQAGSANSFEYYPGTRQERSNLTPTVTRSPIAFLLQHQILAVREAQLQPTHRLMFEMSGRTGMRSSEIRSFPLKFVFNPQDRPRLKPGSTIQIKLDPRDMILKRKKGRIIDIPYSLMSDMSFYAKTHRNLLLREGAAEQTLLLTAHGRPFTKDSVVTVFKEISSIAGFHVRAHLMRHTFAVHFLLKIQNMKEYKGDPLTHLMNQLGHDSIKSVLIYLKHIGQASVGASMDIQRKLDDIYA